MTDYMVRFRKKTSRASLLDNALPYRYLHARAFGALSTSSPSSHSSERRAISTLFTRWPGRNSSAISSALEKVDPRLESGDAPSDVRFVNYPTVGLIHDQSFGKLSLSSRLPRHVPIIIPDFAQPYAPNLPRPSVKALVTTSSEPALRRSPDRQLSADVRVHSSQRSKDTTTETQSTIWPEISVIMNNSQVSLSAPDSDAEHANGAANTMQNSTGPPVGIVSPISQSGAGGANLSGLVCNVHKTTGQEPHALVGATTTILGDKLFVFGGRIHSRSRPQLTADLYELDLIRRHWTRIDTTGDIPPPRYFHSVCALGDTKLVCYGGMSPASHLRTQVNGASQRPAAETQQPEVVVMSDIHIFDVPSQRWHLVAPSTSSSDAPQGRYAHCATILPSSAVFTSPSAPHSAIHHNRPSGDAHSGTLGVHLDGSGGAEMIVVGGQDSANNYIEQISVFNLRSLKWTSITEYDRKCGAYKSMVAPLVGVNAEDMGRGLPSDDPTKPPTGTSMLIYSNYNFLDVKLELQVRLPDGTVIERQMAPGDSPPGLRFPNGGISNSHFVVSGTYLTSTKHEYALWALDLRTLTWHRIDTAGSVFSSGSWNRGILWNRRNQFVILGHRKRNLVDDYNHRRINFTHVCMVELEAFGLYDNPRKMTPTSSYVSRSSPAIPASLQRGLASNSAGGRQLSSIAEQLGQTALAIGELSDMELVAMDGERISCNSQILATRWGPFFTQLLQESSNQADSRTLSDATTLRETMHSQASRISTLTITPTGANGVSAGGTSTSPENQRSVSQFTHRTAIEGANGMPFSVSSRPRALYLPHTALTIRMLLHYLYTSSLPPLSSPLCTPHTLCSLLQMARPYQIDGLLEATVQRLHEVLDGRNAAAVFNAAAMAAGGGRATGSAPGGTLAELERRESQSTAIGVPPAEAALGKSMAQLRVGGGRGHQKSNSVDSTSTATTSSQTDTESSTQDSEALSREQGGRDVWRGEMSSVIGLQKRGLRGLMEGRRLRERANTTGGDS